MANSQQIELLLKLAVNGKKELVDLRGTLAQIDEALKNLPATSGLDAGFDKAKAAAEKTVDSVRKLGTELAQLGKTDAGSSGGLEASVEKQKKALELLATTIESINQTYDRFRAAQGRAANDVLEKQLLQQKRSAESLGDAFVKLSAQSAALEGKQDAAASDKLALALEKQQKAADRLDVSITKLADRSSDLKAKQDAAANSRLDEELAQQKKEADAAALSLQKAATATAELRQSQAASAKNNLIQGFLTDTNALEKRLFVVRAQLDALGQTQLKPLVDSSNLRAFEQRLGAVTTGVTTTNAGVKGLGQTVAGLTPSLENASRSTDTLGGALSNATREGLFLRRAVQGLGLSFLAQEILGIVVSLDKLRAQFSAVFASDASTQLAFIKTEANRLGISITTLGDQYAKFSSAIVNTALEGQKGKDVFLAIAEAGAKLSLSQDDLAGSFKAVQQIASKGRLSLEELSGQLGDRLPGAVRIAAESLGITQAALIKLVETGKVDGTTFLASFGEGLRKNFGTDANTRIETLASGIQRVKNEFNLFIDAVTSGEGVAAIAQVTDALVALFKNPQFISFFQSLVSGLASVTKFAVENGAALKDLLAIYIGFKAIDIAQSAFVSFGKGLAQTSAAIGSAATGLGSVSTSFGAAAGQLSKAAGLAANSAVAFGTGGKALTAFGDSAVVASAGVAQLGGNVGKALPTFTAAEQQYKAFKAGVDLSNPAFGKAATSIEATTKAASGLGAAAATSGKGLGALASTANVAGAAISATANGGLQVVGALGRLVPAIGASILAYEGLKAAADFVLDRQQKLIEADIKAAEAAIKLAVARKQAANTSTLAKDFAEFNEQTKAVQQAAGNFLTFKEEVDLSAAALGKLSPVALIVLATETKVAVKNAKEYALALEANAVIIEADIKATQASSLAFGAKSSKVAELTGALKDNARRLEEVRLKALELGTGLNTANKRVQELLPDLDKINELTLDKAPPQIRAITEALDKAVSSGKGVNQALGDVIPKDFAKGGIEGIETTINALNLLGKEAKVSEGIIKDELTESLKGLSGDELAAFGIKLQQSFEQGKISAQGLNLAIGSQTVAALKLVGVEAGLVGTQVSEEFRKTAAAVSVVVQSTTASAEAIQEALKKAIIKASNLEELKVLKDRFGGLLDDSVTTDAALRFQDKVRLLAGTVDSAVSDSLARLSVQSDTTLKGIAEQSEVDFNRVSTAGGVSFETLQQGFAKVAESYKKINGGKLPIELVVEAVRLDAFDVIVGQAQAASSKVRESFESALANAKTIVQLDALKSAIKNTFASGRVNVEDFAEASVKAVTRSFDIVAEKSVSASFRIEEGFRKALSAVKDVEGLQLVEDKLKQAYKAGEIAVRQYATAIDEARTKAFELATKPAEGFAGAIGRLGVQTKAQLEAIARQSKEDFEQLSAAGVLTSTELEKAFNKYAAAAIAANNGVADSFLESQASGLGFGVVLDSLTSKADNLTSALQAAASIRTIDTASLDSLSVSELQKRKDRNQSESRQSGVSGRTDLRQFFEEQNSEIDALITKKIAEKTQAQNVSPANAPQLPSTPSQSPTTSPVTNNVTLNNNFATSNVTPESIRSIIAEMLEKYAKRTA